jgi:predicted MFS family arabinose efflux permease
MLSPLTSRMHAGRAAVAVVWHNPPLRRLQAAGLLSGTSGVGYGTALFVWAFRSGGASSVGLVGLLVLAPAALLAPFAALVGDRTRRDRTLAVLAASRALLLAVTALAMALGTPPPLVYTVAALAAIPTRVYYPVQAALVPPLARSETELVAANALGSGLENVAILGGAGLAGAMLALVGPSAVVAAAGAVSVVVSLLVRELGDPAVARVPAPGARRAHELLRGAVTIAHDRTLALVVSVYSVQALLFGVLSVVVVKLAIDDLAIGAGGVGLLDGAVGAGGVIGGLIALSLTSRPQLGSDLRLATVVWGGALTLIALVPALPTALVLLLVAGAGSVVVDIASYALLQRAAPDEVRARVFGALEGAAVVSAALGAFLGGVLVEHVGSALTLLVVGLALLAQALALWRPIGQLDRATSTEDAVLALVPEPA